MPLGARMHSDMPSSGNGSNIISIPLEAIRVEETVVRGNRRLCLTYINDHENI